MQQQCELSPTYRCPIEGQLEELQKDVREQRAEFRELRELITTWRTEDAERLTALEVTSKDISGNGQPGRMKDAETRITTMQKTIWWVSGVVTAAQAFAVLIIKYVLLGHK